MRVGGGQERQARGDGAMPAASLWVVCLWDPEGWEEAKNSGQGRRDSMAFNTILTSSSARMSWRARFKGPGARWGPEPGPGES